MNQQAPDLPRSLQIIARYRGLIGFVALLGALAGIIFAALTPPASSSQAMVVFTAPTCPGGAGAICGGPAFSSGYFQAMLLKQFPSGVQVTPAGGNVVSIRVAAGTIAQAEAIADAAAADAGSVSYMGEHASLRVLDAGTSAAGCSGSSRRRRAARRSSSRRPCRGDSTSARAIRERASRPGTRRMVSRFGN